MRFDALYEFCSSLPHATLSVQWGDHDVFKVGGKMFAILTQDLDVGFRLSLKADPEEFDELCGEHGVRPAPYMARNQWVQVVADNSLGHDRLRSLVARSHGLVLEKLPAKQRRSLDDAPAAAGAGEAAPRERAPRASASGGAKRAATGKVEAARKRTTKRTATSASAEERRATKRAGTTGRTTASVGATKRTTKSASAKKRAGAGATKQAAASAKKRTATSKGADAKKRTATSKGAEKRTASGAAGAAKRTTKGEVATTQPLRSKAPGAARGAVASKGPRTGKRSTRGEVVQKRRR